MRIRRRNSSIGAVILGLTVTAFGFQNCAKARFSIDEVAKQNAISGSGVLGNDQGDDGVLGVGNNNEPGNDGHVPGSTNTPGNDGSVPRPGSMGNNTPGNDGSIPKSGMPNMPGNDGSIPKSGTTTGNDPKVPGTTNTTGNDPKVPGTTTTTTPPGNDTSTSSTLAPISIVPSAVCGPSITSSQAMLPNASNVIAVLYNAPNAGGLITGANFIQAWDSAADMASIRSQLVAMKPFKLQTKSKLAAGTYSLVIYDASKVSAPYPYNWTNSGPAVAPVMDSIAHMLDNNSTFTVNSAGTPTGPQTMDVMVGIQGQAVCATAGSIDPLLVQLKTAKPKPIVLTAPDKGVMFDLLGEKNNHKKVSVSWFASADTENYFLVLPDKNGEVLGIDELFGDATLGPDKKYAKQGFAALAKHDDNNDNIISSDDEVFSKLRLWKDKNLDGIVQSDELYTLDEKGIVAIDLRYDKRFKETDKYGNVTKYKSVIVMKDNSYGLVYDLYLRYLAK